MRLNARHVIVVIFLAAVGALLSGCAYADYGKIAVRAIGRELEVMPCADFLSGGIDVWILPPGFTGTATNPYWSAGSDVAVSRGDVLAPNGEPLAWRQATAGFVPEPDRQIDVTIWDRDERYMEPPMRASFVSADVPVDTDQWLLSDGTLSSDPCG